MRINSHLLFSLPLLIAVFTSCASQRTIVHEGNSPPTEAPEPDDEPVALADIDYSAADFSPIFGEGTRFGPRFDKPFTFDFSFREPKPTPDDQDADGIDDKREDHLLETFAPIIWLAQDENRWPVSVDWFLPKVTMRFSHPRTKDCEIIPTGRVTASNMAQQSHQTVISLGFRNHTGEAKRSDAYKGTPDESFFLQFPNDAHHTGSRNQKDWVIYGHVYPVAKSCTVVQYWQLYSYNDSILGFNHEGDWVFSAVLLDKNDKPIKVAFYCHGKVSVEDRDSAIWNSTGKRHFTFSAKGSHEQYARPGVFRVSIDQCNYGHKWDPLDPSFGGIVNIGEKGRERGNHGWLNYSGRWGEIGSASVFKIGDLQVKFTSGPVGPAYQDAWVENMGIGPVKRGIFGPINIRIPPINFGGAFR